MADEKADLSDRESLRISDGNFYYLIIWTDFARGLRHPLAMRKRGKAIGKRKTVLARKRCEVVGTYLELHPNFGGGVMNDGTLDKPGLYFGAQLDFGNANRNRCEGRTKVPKG